MDEETLNLYNLPSSIDEYFSEAYLHEEKMKYFRKEVERWYNSREGKKAVRDSIKLAERIREDFQRCYRVSFELLHRPMTI